MRYTEAREAIAVARAAGPGRLVFAPFDPRERYFARQRLSDLLLEAVHHSAMTTACDALGAGLRCRYAEGRDPFASRAGERPCCGPRACRS